MLVLLLLASPWVMGWLCWAIMLEPDGSSCWDVKERHGWDGVVQLRLRRFSRYTCFRLAKRAPVVLREQGVVDITSMFIIHV